MKRLLFFLTACAIIVCDGCGSASDPKAEQAIKVARKWVVEEGYSLDGLTFRASSNPDTGEWIVLMESNPAPAGGHTTLLLDKDFAVQSVVLGR